MAGVNDSFFFEGTEKLLEVWFKFMDSENERSNLRVIPRNEWDTLLKYVHCEIISEKRNTDTTAYILSESSMFVSKRRFILKTCGTTTLLAAITPLFNLIQSHCGAFEVEDCFYSRKNFMKPQLQHKIHRNFDDEVQLLDDLFPDGAAYVLGRMNRECWYLYTLDRVGVQEPDQTLELLMTNMDAEVMNIFTHDVSTNGEAATTLSKIDTLVPGALIDAHLFEPCGYSMNGLLPDGKYFTIHVTPEAKFSYVSFETNVPEKCYDELLAKVLALFKPKNFLMTIFANKDSVASDYHRVLEDTNTLNNYERRDHQFCQFKNYNLTYSQFTFAGEKWPA